MSGPSGNDMAETQHEKLPRQGSEIARLLKAGDPEGLRQLLAAYGPKVRWWLQNEFGGALNDIEIDESINLAAFRAWRSAATYDEGRGTLRSWFYVIARNATASVLRRERRQRRHYEAVDEPEGIDGLPERPRPVSLRRRNDAHQGFLDHLHECIDRLPPMQMKIIQADLESDNVASAAELAERLQTSTNSIYVSRSIARKTLKRALLDREQGSASEDAEEEGAAP